jgi:hypothetical protein
MAITYSLEHADWEVDSDTGNIRYVGDDHFEASPSYATVIEFHRWLQELADDPQAAQVTDEIYISMLNPSQRSTDNIITLINGYNIDADAAEHLYDGSIIQSEGDEIWDGIVNFGNADVQIQIQQDGIVIADDYWNYNKGGTATGGSGTTLVHTGAFLAEYAGYTAFNVTEGCWGRILETTDTATLTFVAGELHEGTNKDFAASDVYLIGVPLNPNLTQGISHRFMVKVREDGCDIDGRRIVGICRRMGNTYAEFKINGTSRGNNVLALADAEDLNCTTANATVVGAGWDGEFSGEDLGFEAFDVDADGSNEEYYGKYTWTGTHDINDLFEYVKGQTEDGSSYTVHGLNGELLRGITHSFGYNGEIGGIVISDYDLVTWGTIIPHGAVGTGPFVVGEAIHEDTVPPVWKGRVISNDVDASLVVDVTYGVVGTEAFTGQTSGATATSSGTPTVVVSGGVAHVIANDVTDDILYVQMIKGIAPGDDDILYYAGAGLDAADHTDYCVVADEVAPITARTLSTPIIGVSTGTAIIGSYGFGIDNVKLKDTDKVFDLTDTLITPPNLVTNGVSGLEIGEDYVFVAPWDGITYDANGDPAIETDQMTIATGNLTGGGVVAIEVNDIPPSTPDNGTIRVVNNDGFHIRVAYSAYVDATDIFTVTSTDFSGTGLTANADIGNHVYVSYLDKLAAAGTEDFQAVYDSALDLVLVVRDGAATPIKQHIVEWSFTSISQATGVIRTTDA